MRKILIMGLPGAGKTTLAKALVPLLNAVHFNADAVRENINKDLGFSPEDRIEQATRLGWLCDQVLQTGNYAVADFICPLPETRQAFGEDAFIIWVDRIKKSRFEDTNKLFIPPKKYHVHITAEGTPEYWAEHICNQLRPHFNSKKPTAMFLGRYQPFHEGHKQLILEGINRVGQACILVRDTQDTDDKNPFSYEYVRNRIEAGLRGHEGRYVIHPVPNITHIFYGRDVGYGIEQITLPQEIEDISATKKRKAIFDKDS